MGILTPAEKLEKRCKIICTEWNCVTVNPDGRYSVPHARDIYGAAFDENARNLPLSALKNGLIVDTAAADILTKRGVDCGFRSVGGVEYTAAENFADGDDIGVFCAKIY